MESFSKSISSKWPPNSSKSHRNCKESYCQRRIHLLRQSWRRFLAVRPSKRHTGQLSHKDKELCNRRVLAFTSTKQRGSTLRACCIEGSNKQRMNSHTRSCPKNWLICSRRGRKISESSKTYKTHTKSEIFSRYYILLPFIFLIE